MRLTNISNYPVTVKGLRIEQGETKELEIEDVEKYENDRRFEVEEDDKPESDEEDGSEDEQEISKPEKQNKGD